MQCSATDIGGRGCYVETLVPLSVDTEVVVSFWVDSDKIATKGRVRTSDPAVGMGIGVDYILYVVDRVRREVPLAGGDMIQGVKRAISTTGMAVTFTATTMIAGIIPWYFMSSLRFSAEMAILLAILLMTHWLSALTLTPAMFSIFKPKFARGEGVGVRVAEEEPPPPRD